MGKCFLYKSGGGELVEDLPEDAILALENKGVTVSPEQAKIGNLANLINKIEKPQALYKTGSATIKNGKITLEFSNIGFEPDIIFLHQAYSYNGKKYETVISLPLFSGASFSGRTLEGSFSDYEETANDTILKIIYCTANKTARNVTISFTADYYSYENGYSEGVYNGDSFNWRAIKYTE